MCSPTNKKAFPVYSASGDAPGVETHLVDQVDCRHREGLHLVMSKPASSTESSAVPYHWTSDS